MEGETAIVKTRKSGGSIVITVPSEITEIEQIGANEFIEVKFKKKRTDYFGALKGIGAFTKEDKFRGQLED